ncbi:efflux transporter periplasmic adaptor subunit [Kaistia algarum]|uniref:efflux RND transporter periplasmic adaptor subunit n=1 Tax=Kaistia algarum TaxID=2083279 RepID=UPI000CE8462B|nr:efflux RND transporter periplasmic adaptor subunit [Kaistia algarum]MCX5513910.1 efflux RND transporter periplasmic adaptor subunit [Kaistia algarum]PPE77542.1 efflux transporter periplasmic adaptor subunit [Kaistia algarum]
MKRLKFSLLCLAVAACLSPAGAAEFVAKIQTVPELKAVYGEVESSNVVPARARIGGTIRAIKVEEGQEVSEGEVVAEVVDDKLALQLDAADARIKQVQSQLASAQLDLDRAQQLLQRGVASQARVDQAKTAYDVAVNQVAAAQSDRAVIQQQAQEGAVLAPATGRVLSVPVTLGSVLLAGESVARIATGQYYLRLSLPERHAAQIRTDATVLVGQRGLSSAEGGAPPATREGRIAKVYPEISDGRVTADVAVDGIGDYFVNERTLVWIPVGSRQAIGIPPEAVTTKHGVDYVRLVGGEGEMDVAVILGSTFEQGGKTYVDVLTGLRDGDRILLPEATK